MNEEARRSKLDNALSGVGTAMLDLISYAGDFEICGYEDIGDSIREAVSILEESIIKYNSFQKEEEQ
jgi:hypothetical protein